MNNHFTGNHGSMASGSEAKRYKKILFLAVPRGQNNSSSFESMPFSTKLMRWLIFHQSSQWQQFLKSQRRQSPQFDPWFSSDSVAPSNSDQTWRAYRSQEPESLKSKFDSYIPISATTTSTNLSDGPQTFSHQRWFHFAQWLFNSKSSWRSRFDPKNILPSCFISRKQTLSHGWIISAARWNKTDITGECPLHPLS